MNRQEIQELQAVREYPSVSILMPVYRKSPDDLAQNPIRVKNLVRQSIDRLLNEFSKRDIQPLLQQLDQLTDRIDFSSPKDGLALFANKEMARMFHLPYSPPERVVVDKTFATRELVHARNRTKRYRILVLSQDAAHLHECERESCHEVRNDKFPMSAQIEGVETVMDSTYGIDTGKYDNKQDHLFFQHVDHALDSLQGDDPLPLAVVGVERNLSHFKSTSKHTGDIIATVEGNFEKVSLHELTAKTWPQVRKGFNERREQLLQQFGDAIGAGRSASGIQDIWQAAHDGRIATLLVDENFHHPARTDENGALLQHADNASANGNAAIGENTNGNAALNGDGPHALDDAVDEIVEQVIEKSGEVVFFDSGTLFEHNHIAAILRY